MAFNLRTPVTAVGPVIEQIRGDTGMSSSAAGVLTSLPLLCMGVFSLVGIGTLRRVRAVQIVTWCTALLGAGTLLRSAMPTPWLLILATIPIGIAMALIQVALPGVIKTRFRAPGAATGTYVASQSLGSALLAVLVVPLAHAVGGWRPALALLTVPMAIALPLWLRGFRHLRRAAAPVAGEVAQVGRRWPRGALLLGLMFGAQSICYNGMISWIAALYVEHGWHAGRAALATAALSFLTIPAAMVLPRLSDRGDRYRWIMAAAAAMIVGLLGLALVPTTLPWLWIVVMAVGNGSIFPMMLTLPLDLRDDPHDVSVLSGWMMSLGYLLSSIGPVLVGAVRDLSGGFTLALLALAVVAAPAGLLAPAARRAGRAGASEAGYA